VFDGVAADLQSVSLSWDAWHDTIRRFDLPGTWSVVELRMADASPLATGEITAALEHSLEAPPLDRLIAGRRRAAIAVDDLTRPTNSAPIVEWIVARLREGGLEWSDIAVVMASGAHKRADARAVELKVGPIANRVRVVPLDV